ncbi:MAG: sporulation transcriptional regulator SpoIIID [Bacilli bacterium]|nr:sporulation transcriptional regulator SpoIIID [Bacilli bacterium]
MTLLIKERVLREAKEIILTKDTIRSLAFRFNVSKSTVHKDLHERLVHLDKDLFRRVNDILKYHANIRHVRGGQSTKKKYEKMV